MDGTVEIEPFYHQGLCYIKDTGRTSVPCQNGDGEYNCTEKLFGYKFCRGFSVSLGAENCEE